MDFTEQDDDQESYHYEDYNNNEEDESETHDDINPNELAEILDDNPIQDRIPIDNNPMDQTTHIENNTNDDNKDEDVPETPPTQVRRSARIAKPTERYLSYIGGNYNQIGNKPNISQEIEYSEEEATVIATIMGEFNERMNTSKIAYENQFVVTYSLKKGIKEFGEQGRNSVLKEMRQLHERECFKPIDINTLTPIEKQRALELLIFLTEKNDGTIKARHCAIWKPPTRMDE